MEGEPLRGPVPSREKSKGGAANFKKFRGGRVMIIFPAIDIKDGKVVRLLQGNFDEVTEYSGDPVVVARKWQEKGAPWIHVVDLDGARTGQLQNYEVIIKIANSVDIPIQVGGGIRQEKDVQRLIKG